MIWKVKSQKGFGLLGLLITMLIIGLMVAYSIQLLVGPTGVKDSSGKEVRYNTAIDQANTAHDALEQASNAAKNLQK